MVVSVDITGVLEERLRRLVDLGIYASVSEAVRDALRRLMDELDLHHIGLMLYRSGNATLSYICEFTDSPCNRVISYFLENGTVPLLGSSQKPARTEIPNQILLAPSALFTVYTSYLGNLLWKLREGGTRLYMAADLENEQRLWEAYSIHKGILRHVLAIEAIEPCARMKEKINSKILLSKAEKSTVNAAKTCNIPVLTVDQRLREALEGFGIKTVGAVELLYEARARQLISTSEALDIVYSLKSVPLILPPSAFTDLGR
ncbi:MAG: hypothetical protein F7C34_00655 [Desulfurococcales archaeon]|nr:hypothetical protein [Desulfurococcales archaeon]